MEEQQDRGPVAVICNDCGESFTLESSDEINKYIQSAKESGTEFHCAECEKRSARKKTLKMQLADAAKSLGFHFGV